MPNSVDLSHVVVNMLHPVSEVNRRQAQFCALW